LQKRSLALLLWNCPLCHTADTLRVAGGLVLRATVSCQRCGARWRVKHVVAHDFRLELLAGPADLIGLDMPLSAWYDEVKRAFQPCPIAVNGLELLPGEQVYLEVPDSSLMPHRPNKLYDTWSEREAPRVQSAGRYRPGDWESLGTGRLLLTSERLAWQGPKQQVDFYWPAVSAANLWLLNTLFLSYGKAPYRLTLGQETGLKWLTHVKYCVDQAAEREGRVAPHIRL
jgi:hypothetical protein